ncbi:MAG: indolepyruvate ferredoxin oxidoreductase subunit alpha [Rubrobacteridae bacterium]|nr:indolepyruvate ferredoxin oxidoreductase subunit alpha [Rubrobacteridae bacterium]
MKRLLSGNEAIAHGAYTAGVTVAVGYPGTPSTEILENIVKYEEVDASWCPNEKVALEVAIGASIAGARAIVTMKHVGLNVAADPLFTLAYVGVGGGLVIISADDPSMHSSQNEQDNRHYAKAARIRMLEPGDSAEAAWLVDEGFKISEMFDTPVILRTTTRINHSKSLVPLDCERVKKEVQYEKNSQKYVMIPANARNRRILLENRMAGLQEYSEQFTGNRVEWNGLQVGIITSGISYQYVKEAFPEASILKLTMTNPLPRKLIEDFANQVERAIVVEELDPFIEDQVKAWGLQVSGKDSIPGIGELSSEIVRTAFSIEIDLQEEEKADEDLPQRPPMMCPGCPHRGIFHELRKLKLVVTGDIGCYTLGVLPPLDAMDTCICMGASIGNALGFQKATGRKDVVAVIGDSTFMHSGVAPLMDIIYNNASTTTIIVDNRTTAMTGRQGHPGTGITLTGEKYREIDIERLVRAIGVESVRMVDPYDLKMVRQVIEEEVVKNEPSVIISRRPCLLIEKQVTAPLAVTDDCEECKSCIKLGCHAISWEDNRARIEPASCTGCNLCRQLCKFNAIVEYAKSASEEPNN